jgi:mRNA interferase MazF
MQKDFDSWNEKKKIINYEKVGPFFHQREVWWVNLGLNVGFEQDGKGGDCLRPVVIIKKFNNELCWGIPTTRKNKSGKYYFHFAYKQGEYTTAILSQLRLIDSKRLNYKLGVMVEEDFLEMKKRLISFLK